MKKAYAKIRDQELEEIEKAKPVHITGDDDEGNSNGNNNNANTVEDNGENASEEFGKSTTLELHPDRQAMLSRPSPQKTQKRDQDGQRQRRNRRPKRSAFSKELEIAEARKREAEARRKERELKQKEREAMARARRPDRDGKRRLGRESKVLLGRVQRIVGQAEA